MPTIEIQAIDTLFFRDGRPFEMGDDNWAEGIFPPPPSVIYGALRSAYFAEYPEDLKYANTENDPTKKHLRITGIYLSRKKNGNHEVLLPFPKDFFQYKDDDVVKNSYFKITDKTSVKANYPFDYIPIAAVNENNEYKFINNAESIEGYTTLGDIVNYLKTLDENITLITEKKLLTSEYKIGIGRENLTHATSTGELYRVGLNRLNFVSKDEDQEYETSLIVEYTFDGHEDFVPEIIRLGAENKTALCRPFNEELLLRRDFSLENCEYFKIVLTTPAIFENGMFPNFSKYKDDIKLILAFVGKYENYGGWDILKNEPKLMQRAVPAGSVFWYKATDYNTAKQITDEIGKLYSISDFREKEGFGLFFIANLNFNEIKINQL